MSSTPIVFDKPRTLRFRISDVIALERDLGCGVNKLQEQGQYWVALEALLYYGLRHEDPALTQAIVKKRLDRFQDKGGDPVQLAEAVWNAFFDSGVYGQRVKESARTMRAEDTEAAEGQGEDDESSPLSGSLGSSSGDGSNS